MTDIAPPPESITPASAPADRIGLAVGDRLELLLVTTIDWLEADGNYVRVHAAGAVHLARTTLAALWRRVGTAMFAQVHRGIVVNVHRVTAVRPRANGDCMLVMATGEELRMSRRYRAGLLSTLR